MTRLTKKQKVDVVTAFRSGMPMHNLAARYDVYVRTIEAVIRAALASRAVMP